MHACVPYFMPPRPDADVCFLNRAGLAGMNKFCANVHYHTDIGHAFLTMTAC
jgi:hypothetical protein